MKHLICGCITFVLVSVMAAGAYADEPAGTPAPAPAAASEAPAPAPAPAPPPARKFAGARTSRYVSGGVADSAFWTVGMTFPPGFSVAAGVNINYDGNGLPIPGSLMRSEDKFSFQGLIYGSYYIYNKFPAGIAIETALITPLVPKAADPFLSIRPGVVFYYAPFAAPLVIGSGLSLNVTFPKGGNATVQTLSPGVRLIYVF